ncbi:hypothetical protein NUH30_18980 [Leptospira sp. 85282-16]|uniref:hypothetical protein n=1 Tax=Leptospira sp. 85282-16 TaxID=2971256 RepID=UPI0021C242EE|nr:hypothetical protein [Leptospira sp. 85282-16]MCT8335778.1 hypothetical protein [Leptospira sp. 85282-16]
MHLSNTFETNLINYIESFYKNFTELGFKFYSKKVGPGMSAPIELSNLHHNLEIINDRSQYFIDIKTIINNSMISFQLDLIISQIILHNLEESKKTSRKSILLGNEFPDLLKDPLKYYFLYQDEINKILFDEEFRNVYKKLQKERASFIFPKKSK